MMYCIVVSRDPKGRAKPTLPFGPRLTDAEFRV